MDSRVDAAAAAVDTADLVGLLLETDCYESSSSAAPTSVHLYVVVFVTSVVANRHDRSKRGGRGKAGGEGGDGRARVLNIHPLEALTARAIISVACVL